MKYRLVAKFLSFGSTQATLSGKVVGETLPTV